MLYSNKNIELEKLNELISLQKQVNEVRLPDKLGEQIYLPNVKKLYEPVLIHLKIPLKI